MWNQHGRAMVTRSGQEAAAALTTRYQEQIQASDLTDDDLRQPISASEVEEASNMVFQRSPATPSDYVFSPSATVPAGQEGGRIYPRLSASQIVESELFSMGHRLASEPRVQRAIVDDLLRHSRRVATSGRRSINPSLQCPPESERGLADLVDMLEAEDDQTGGSDRIRGSRSGRVSGQGRVDRGGGGFLDADDHETLRHIHLDPHVADEWRNVYAAVQDDGWQPWVEEEKKENVSEGGVSSRISDGKLSCSCRKCHETKDEGLEQILAAEGACWKDVLAEYECDICFEVLVGVHVLDNCGHHFCGSCMERWMDNAPQAECPVCRMPADKMVPVRKFDEMVAKAVDAAAPSRERSAWYERRSHWESTARQRQARARAASSAQSEGSRSSSSRRHSARGAGRRRGHGDDDEEEGEDSRFCLTKMQAVLAVAVMLVVAVMKMRGLKR